MSEVSVESVGIGLVLSVVGRQVAEHATGEDAGEIDEGQQESRGGLGQVSCVVGVGVEIGLRARGRY